MRRRFRRRPFRTMYVPAQAGHVAFCWAVVMMGMWTGAMRPAAEVIAGARVTNGLGLIAASSYHVMGNCQCVGD